MTNNFDYREALKKIPHKPGVYQFWDTDKELIYIGKAKDLRNRVTSYFNKDNQFNAKTRVLVSKIRDITFTIVDTEIDAWLLENAMIKKHQPRYNVKMTRPTPGSSSKMKTFRACSGQGRSSVMGRNISGPMLQ